MQRPAADDDKLADRVAQTGEDPTSPSAGAHERGPGARALRVAVRVVLLVVTLALAAVVTRYLVAPVGRLRDRITYTPAGATAAREAGLAVTANVGLDAVPEAFLVALLYNEDKKFFEHHGFDVEQIEVSLREWMSGERRLRGASTVTQQLARTIFEGSGRTFRRKVVEAIDTVKLERTFSKDEILLLYVNTVAWGPGVYGVAAAADHYFKKAPADLDPMECVYLAAILPSPGRLGGDLDSWQVPHATATRMRRLLAGVRGEDGARNRADPVAPLLAAVRAARERAHARRAAG